MKRVAVVVALVVSTVMGTSSVVSANKKGGACKKAGTKTGIPGGTLVCTRVTSGKNKGKLVWTRMSSGSGSGSSSSSGGGSSSSGQVNLGGSCSESSGALKWSSIGAVVVCKGGKYKYAIPGDFSATPAGKPAPSSLTASSGAVVYDLHQLSYDYSKPAGSTASAPVGYKLQRGQSKGQVILQVNADGSLSVEFGSAFTAAKRTYRR